MEGLLEFGAAVVAGDIVEKKPEEIVKNEIHRSTKICIFKSTYGKITHNIAHFLKFCY